MKSYISFVILILLFFHNNCLIAQRLIKYESSQPKMGTAFKILFYALDTVQSERIIDNCWDRVDELNNVFSDYIEESEATKLSESLNTKEWMYVSDDMWFILKEAHNISLQTNGAFDVTLGVLTKLWRRAIRQNELPSEKELNEAKKSAGYELIEYHPTDQKIRLREKGLRFDFGGIAKGYTVDEIYKVLLSEGIKYAIVDGGGDLFIGNQPKGIPGWSIKATGDLPDDISIVNMALASSGDLYKNVQRLNARYSHIVDTNTGVGVKSLSKIHKVVNVTAPRCVLADALATALSVAGELQREQIILKYPKCAYFISEITHKE